MILLGTGWRGYDPPPDIFTCIYYRNILHHKYLHALRDTYSVLHLKKTFLPNLIHTSCPTTWNLDPGFVNNFDTKTGKTLFTLTDYNKDPEADTRLIQHLFNSQQQDLFFFPQGNNDLDYLQSLDIYKKNKPKFRLLNYTYNDFEQFVKSTRFNYVGTRLHAGLFCLNANNPTLIIGIDNRAIEIGKDINMNVADRKNDSMINGWLENKYIAPILQIPIKNITEWKSQFKKI